MSGFTLAELAKQIGAELHGDGDIVVHSIGTLAGAQQGKLSFLSNSKYRSQLSETAASAVIIGAEDKEWCKTNAMVMKNPYLGFALVAQILDSTPDAASDISASANISPSASLGKNVRVGANAVIEDGAHLEDDVQIGLSLGREQMPRRVAAVSTGPSLKRRS